MGAERLVGNLEFSRQGVVVAKTMVVLVKMGKSEWTRNMFQR